MNDEVNQRHKERMQRKKAVVDHSIAQAQQRRGIIVINCGNGKGKSSSGFGMVIRAIGNQIPAAVVQFIKGAHPTGEEKFLRRFPDEVQFHVMGEGYTWETQDRSRDIEKAQLAWQQACVFLRDDKIGLLLLDELNIALKYQYLDVQQVIRDLQARPASQHVIITGRGAPPELIEIADTVSEMHALKHAFSKGIAAQAGIEF